MKFRLVPTRTTTPRILVPGALLCFLLASSLRMAAQTSGSANDDIVTLDEFKVSSTIGTYHEATSSMATKMPMT